jgi:hypothetical protein
MNSTQKTIKYVAMGFAIFLAFSILSSVVGVIIFALDITNGNDTEYISDSFSINDKNIKDIKIDGYIYTTEVKQGEDFQVELSNVSENYTATVDNETLELGYEGFSWDFFSWIDGSNKKQGKGRIILTIPTDYKINNFDVEAGVGNFIIHDLNTKYLSFDGGAGSINASNIIASKEANINCGAGSVELKNVALNNLNLDSGVGSSYIQGLLTGYSSLDCGIGALELILQGSSDEYNINIDVGLGKATVNGQKYSDITWNNSSAKNSLDLDGGIGDITVEFEQQSK